MIGRDVPASTISTLLSPSSYPQEGLMTYIFPLSILVYFPPICITFACEIAMPSAIEAHSIMIFSWTTFVFDTPKPIQDFVYYIEVSDVTRKGFIT